MQPSHVIGVELVRVFLRATGGIAFFLALLVASPALATPQTLLDQWVGAQNRGDFAAYQALYAPGFLGVKRVGATTKQMDRAAWLTDRKAMFRSPMKVTTSAVTTRVDGPTVVVELVQTWEQGAFADTGRKRLVLDARTDAILAEEMLDSRVLLTETACVRALYPDAASRQQTDHVTILDLPQGVFACRIVNVPDHDDARRYAVVGLLVRGKTWEVVHEETFSFDYQNENEEQKDGDVTVTPIVLTAKETAVLVTTVTDENAPMHHGVTRKATLYRVTPRGWTELFSFESGGSSGEADDETTCTLVPKNTRTRGLPDLDIECHRRKADYHGPNGEEVTETAWKSKYRWTGKLYEKRR
jgi:Domain of unknown function (DUF4440)